MRWRRSDVCVLALVLLFVCPKKALANCAFVSRVDWSYPADGATEVPTNSKFWFLGDGLLKVELDGETLATVDSPNLEQSPKRLARQLMLDMGELAPNTEHTLRLHLDPMGNLGDPNFQEWREVRFTTGDGPLTRPPAKPEITGLGLVRNDSPIDDYSQSVTARSCEWDRAIAISYGGGELMVRPVHPVASLFSGYNLPVTAGAKIYLEGWYCGLDEDRECQIAESGEPACFQLVSINAAGLESESEAYCVHPDGSMGPGALANEVVSCVALKGPRPAGWLGFGVLGVFGLVCTRRRRCRP